MALHALDPAHFDTACVDLAQPGSAANENIAGRATAQRSVVDYWQVAAIGLGVLASAAWSFGLLYAAYRVLIWAFGD